MSGDNISQHPNAILRREIELLKKRIKSLEAQHYIIHKANLALVDRLEALRAELEVLRLVQIKTLK